MGRLIVVSNRLPQGATPSGGLVVALDEVLRDTKGLWIGHSGRVTDTPRDGLDRDDSGSFPRLSFDLTPEEQDGYYLGFSNSVLWPLCHGRADLMDLRPADLPIYKAVNRRIAALIAAELRPGDRLWVQDYHLLPLAAALRHHGVTAPIGFFLHIPFPNVADAQALPNLDQVLGWLAAYDLVGLQTRRDVSAALEVVRQSASAALQADGSVRIGSRTTRIEAFPIGIDAASFAAVAKASAGVRPVLLPPESHLMIGVDRLDYSKGLPNRFKAFQHLLDQRKDLAGHLSLLQIAPPTREDVQAYQDIREDLERLSGAINGAHADLNWTPIRYIHRPIERNRLAGLYRQARIGLVTPLADGMNLVAKEYVAAQNPENPGVLILSRFAGAAEQMEDGALMVNPYDPGDMAQAMVTALWMTMEERRKRHARLMDGLLREDARWWADKFLARLNGVAGPTLPVAC